MGLLLEQGADVNHVNHLGDSPLILAANNGNRQVVRSLLTHHANPNHENKYGDTPLTKAMNRDGRPMVELLLENGMDVNYTNKDGMTALSMAKSSDDTEMAEMLLAHGAIDNAMDVEQPIRERTQQGTPGAHATHVQKRRKSDTPSGHQR